MVGLEVEGLEGLRFSAIEAAKVGGSGVLTLGSIEGPVGADGVVVLAKAVGGAEGNVEGVAHHEGCGNVALTDPLGGPRVGAVARKGGLRPPCSKPTG